MQYDHIINLDFTDEETYAFIDIEFISDVGSDSCQGHLPDSETYSKTLYVLLMKYIYCIPPNNYIQNKMLWTTENKNIFSKVHLWTTKTTNRINEKQQRQHSIKSPVDCSLLDNRNHTFYKFKMTFV